MSERGSVLDQLVSEVILFPYFILGYPSPIPFPGSPSPVPFFYSPRPVPFPGSSMFHSQVATVDFAHSTATRSAIYLYTGGGWEWNRGKPGNGVGPWGAWEWNRGELENGTGKSLGMEQRRA